MAITLIREPGEISFSRNPMIYELRTNAVVSSPGRKFIGNLSIISLAGISVNSQLTFNFLGKSFVFSFRAVPDDSGLQLPTVNTGETVGAYLARLAQGLRENYYISRYYDLTVNPTTITFVAKEEGIDYNMTIATTPTTFMSMSMSQSGLTESRNPNLQVLVELYSGKNGFIVSAALLPDDTGLVRWDISSALTASLLSEGHDRPSVLVPVMEKGKTTDSYHIKYTEMYGDLQMARKVYTSATNYVAYGGFAKSVLAERTVTGYLLDGSKSKFLNTFFDGEKVIKYDQPCFLYWLNLGANVVSLQVEVTLYYSDESTDTYVANSLANVKKYDKAIVPSGIRQLNAHLRDDQKIIVEYEVVLKSGVNEVSPKVRFVVDHKPEPYARFFVYENSLGAYETVYMHGKKSIGYEIDASTAKLMSVSDFVLADGEEIEYDLTLRESETINTGFKPKREIRALRDFFLSGEKYVYKNARLYPVALTSKSIDEFEDGQNLYALSFEIGCKYVEELFGGDDEELGYTYAPNLQAYVPKPPEVPPINYDDRYYLKTETYNKTEVDNKVTILQSAFDALEMNVGDALSVMNGLIAGKSDIGHVHPEYTTWGDLYDALLQSSRFMGNWEQPIVDVDEDEDPDEGYLQGQFVIHNDNLWESLIDENFDEPTLENDESWILALEGLSLGETSDTAFDGARGKIAYDHSQEMGNPHNTGIGDIVGLGAELDLRANSETQINTDSTMKGGGNLSADRTLGIADNMIPATSSLLTVSENLDNVRTPGNRYASASVASLERNYPIAAEGHLQVFRFNNNTGVIQMYTTATSIASTTCRVFIRRLSTVITSWIELANDAEVVHKTGDETISGFKTVTHPSGLGLHNTLLSGKRLYTSNTTGAKVIRVPKGEMPAQAYAIFNIKFFNQNITGGQSVADINVVLYCNVSNIASQYSTALIKCNNTTLGAILSKVRVGQDADYFYIVFGDVGDDFGGSGCVFIIDSFTNSNINNKPSTFTIFNLTDLSGLTLNNIAASSRVLTTMDIINLVQKSGDTMTGTLVLAGGTTTNPPVKGQGGVLTTVPQAYAEEVVSDGKYFTNGASERNALEEKPLIKNVTTTTYTALASDYNKFITFNNANPIQFTIPASTFTAGQSIKGRQAGLGQVEFVAGAGLTLLSAVSDSLFTAEQNAVFEIFFESPTQAIVYGRLELL